MENRLEKLVVMIDRSDFGQTAIELCFEDFQDVRGDAGAGFLQSESGTLGAEALCQGWLRVEVRGVSGEICCGIFGYTRVVFAKLRFGKRVRVGGRGSTVRPGRPGLTFMRGRN
jgi:hypothetical protein